ncbi:WG repeat-containing protein [Eikenella corrodens]|uniref:WG repeat-containing protein n=1 Tax=Eikenella corrodens TaxID=539 RepID=UPI0028EEAED4|nr:WG repeat-containing protein [Eikenella corrodens]
MQKTAITLGLCLAFGIPAQAETGSPQSGLSRLCLKKEKACAYYYGDGKLAFITNWDSISAGENFDQIDLSKGNALIPAEDRANGKYGYKQGYINIKGQWVIQPQFYKAYNFSNGLAAVQTERSSTSNYYAYINTQGQIAIPTGQYESLHGFADNGLAAVRVIGKDNVAFIDKQGNIVKFTENGTDAKVFGNNGLVPLEAEDKNCRQKLWGYADTSGNFVIPPQFTDAEAFASNGLAVARPFDTKNCGKDVYFNSSIKGYIDSRGQWVIPPQYEEAFPFLDNGLAAAKYNGKWGMIDRQGNWVLAPTITNKGIYNINVFSTNGLLTGHIDKEWASFNSKGEKIVFSEKICNGEVAVLKNRAGQILLPHGKSQKQICKDAKASQSPSRSESSSSDSRLVSASIFFEADIGWPFDTVSLETPQGTFIANEGKGESVWNFHVARATKNNSIPGKYSYSYTLKSSNGSNYKSCSGSFNVKESGGSYVNIKTSSNCNIFVYQK